jgi:hypothetical protein
MSMRPFHDHAAGHDLFVELVQFFGFFTNIRLQGFGAGDIAEGDLQGLFHGIESMNQV